MQDKLHASGHPQPRGDGAALLVRPLHTLPAAPRPLVGRTTERARIIAQLHDPACRLLTITGPGGVGKTCLALDVARALLPAEHSATPFTAGVFFVPLAGLDPAQTGPELLAATIADTLALDIVGAHSVVGQLVRALGDRPLLLVLDNCEHLPGLTALLSDLLLGAPELTVLATARGPLGLRREWVIDLDGLPVPPAHAEHEASGPSRALVGEAGYDAVQLFVESARSVSAAFAYTPANAAFVAQICRQVAGLPLGIELAASWTRVLSCSEIAGEIAQNLDFLVSELHDLPARQQSLRAVFNSSWALLTAAEQQAARRLAAFQGAFTRAAATAVAGADLALLGALVKKSLVRRVAADDAGTRYALLDPLRPYAAEQLAAAGEAEATLARHAEHYLGWLADQQEQIRGPDQQATLAAISAEMVELRAAWRLAITARAGTMLSRAAESLFLFCAMCSRFQEGAALLLDAAHALDAQAEPLIAGRLLSRAGWCVFQLGRVEEAQGLLGRGLELLRPLGAPAELVTPLNYLASLARHTGAHAEALTLAREGLEHSTAGQDRYGMAITATTLSQTFYAMGRYVDARQYAEQSFALERALGNSWGLGFNLLTLGQIARAQGEHQAARDFFQEALATRAQLRDRRGMALCLNELGDTAMALDEHAVAGWCYEQSFDLSHTIGNLWGEVAALRRLGQLARGVGQPGAAARLYDEALRRARDSGSTQAIHAAEAALAELALGAAAPVAPATSLRQAIAAVLAASATGADNAGGAPATSVVLPQPTSAAEGVLTVRELEVLRLVATGLTDAQVAERLVLSTRTVSSYLSTIYSKLQLRSRSAATRWAIEHGLG